jgi:hypothetical protein
MLLVYFNLPYPAFKDDFHPVRQLVKAWNDNMFRISVAAWIVCLDESMSLWTNMWTCPGFVFCPLKSPGIQATSITLLLVGFVPSYFTWRWWKEKGEQKTLAKWNLNYSERRSGYYCACHGPFGIQDGSSFSTLAFVCCLLLLNLLKGGCMAGP